jgi:glycerate kinase
MNLKVIVAPDSFKGSVSAVEAALAIERGIRRVFPNADIVKLPAGDGGEGTMDCILTAAGGSKVELQVTGPLHTPVQAEFALLNPDSTAIIEMASASGICLVPTEQLNPLIATTYGTGELIKAALDQGCRSFILALGGSATNDGGAGMLQALGMRLLDAEGKEVGFGGGELGRIVTIDDTNFDTRVKQSQFLIATDVQNPLIGLQGASHVYGPQKGATPEMVEELDRNMSEWADRIADQTGIRIHEQPGAGAAGGICGALLAFFPAEIQRGIDVFIERSRMADHLPGADLVITGEGRFDSQTASGKTPMGIAQAASKFSVPTLVLAGSVGKGIDALYDQGILGAYSIVNGPMKLEEAISRAAELLEDKAEQVARTFFYRKQV